MKSNKEVILEMVDIIAEAISSTTGASTIMLRPALNIVKLKTSNMTESDSAEIVDKVHWLSRHIEKETGIFSQYHGIDE